MPEKLWCARPLKACELADIFNSHYGNVCFAGIDCDPNLKYRNGVCSSFSAPSLSLLLYWQQHLSLYTSVLLPLCRCWSRDLFLEYGSRKRHARSLSQFPFPVPIRVRQFPALPYPIPNPRSGCVVLRGRRALAVLHRRRWS